MKHVQRVWPGRLTLAGVLLLGLAGVAAMGGAANAHDTGFKNSVNLTRAEQLGPAIEVYEGRVESVNPRCERRREVQLWRSDVNPEVRVLTIRTTPAGLFKKKGPALPVGAKVYALIETRFIPTPPAHDHTCPVDRSPVVTTPYP